MADIALREVEKGPAFATYEGSACVVRADWSVGAVRLIYVGHIETAVAQVCIKHWAAAMRTAPKVILFMDYWDATGYETGWRVEATAFAKKNDSKISHSYILSRSKLLNMAVSVAGLAVPSVVLKSFGKRVEFDVEAKKAGLPINPPLPQLVAPKTG